MKYLTCCLMIIMTVTFCGCSGDNNATIDNWDAHLSDEAKDNTEDSHYSDLTNWTVLPFVDAFGDETSGTYIGSSEISGSFSNTATNNSDLTVFVFYDEQFGFSFRLLEYGNHKATFLASDNPHLYFKLDESTYILSFVKGRLTNSDLSISDPEFQTKSASLFRDTLLSGGSLPCVIINHNSEYSFTIDGSGFSEALHSLETAKSR